MEEKIIFGTDGWRGLLDTEINEQTVAIAAQAFADYLKLNDNGSNNISIAVAFDGRRKSREFASIFSRVVSGNNIKVFLSDRIEPTPILSYYVKVKGLNAGVMITASHNPSQYNGIKFKGPYGGPFLTEETLKVEELLYKTEPVYSEDNITLKNLRRIYLEQINRLINFDVIENSGLNVLVDSMGGAGQQLFQQILTGKEIECKTIYGLADESFSGRYAEPIEKNLKPLQDELQKGNYSLGLATDGDADRIGVMLNDGSWLSAQETILYIADYLANVKKLSGNIVKTSSVTDKIKLFENDSVKVFDVQVGFKYICEKMISEDVLFGAEESGGFGYKGHIPERDGILSGLIICEMLASSDKLKLSDYVEEKRTQFGKIYYDRIDMEYHKSDRIEILPNLFNNPPDNLAGYAIKNIDKYYSSRGIINGLKFVLEGSPRWILIRASETEPLIRIYSEAENISEVKNILESGRKLFI